MLQRSPELQKIFEDIFKSIVKFSNYLSQDDVSVAIDEFMTSVGKIYEGLKPLGVAIADIGSTVGINGLKSITSILSAFGAALDAIPEPAIKLFAGFIVTMGAVRAPLMLLKYVNSFQNLYQGGAATAAARVALAGERLRLLYVGITRARRELIITWNTGRGKEPARPALAFAALAGK